MDNQQIGWSTEAKLLHRISKELERLAGLVGKGGGGGGTVVDATPTVKGIIQLAGDLGGTAAAPTVPNMVRLTTAQTISNKNIVPRISVTTGATSGSIALNVDNFDITRYNNITGNIVLAAPGGTPVDGKAIMYMFYATASFLIDCTNAAFIGSNTLTLPTSMPAMTNSVVWKIQFRYSALSGKYELEFFG